MSQQFGQLYEENKVYAFKSIFRLSTIKQFQNQVFILKKIVRKLNIYFLV